MWFGQVDKPMRARRSNCRLKGVRMNEGLGSLIGWAVGLAMLAAWLTHLYVCFTDERWGFLIAGALFFPVAIIHGIGLWFGLWS